VSAVNVSSGFWLFDVDLMLPKQELRDMANGFPHVGRLGDRIVAPRPGDVASPNNVAKRANMSMTCPGQPQAASPKIGQRRCAGGRPG